MHRFAAAATAASVLAATAGAQAQAPPPDPDARIAALEAELKKVEAELAELKSQGHVTPEAPATVTPAPKPPGTPIQTATASDNAPSSAATSVNPGAPSTKVGQVAAQDETGQIRLGTPTSAATASIAGGRPAIQSSDGAFTASLLGVMQFDAADYKQATPGPTSTDLRRGATASDTAHARDLSSGTNFRRARIGLGGKVFSDFEYTILYEYGGAGEEDAGHVQELWVQYSGLRPFHARVGAFPPSIGLEDQGSTNGMPFLERPAPADIARSLAGGDFREAGELVANTDRWYASAAVTGRLVGVVNASGSGVSQPYDSQLGWVGRAAFIPFKGKDYLVHLGVHGSYVEHPADAGGPDASASAARYPLDLRERPELRVDGTRLIDTGSIDAAHGYTVGGEFAATWRNLFLQGEYDQVGIERRLSTLPNPTFPGWYVEGSWILTGEQRRYNTGNFAFDGPPVRHNFDPRRGQFGALELALRYSDENLNFRAGQAGAAPSKEAVRGGEQRIFTAGLNWYLNPVVRFMFDYQHVMVDRLSPDALTFMTPVGAEIGQTYDVLAMRSQLAF
jgi:phosphate-selective porin OprO and OprP